MSFRIDRSPNEQRLMQLRKQAGEPTVNHMLSVNGSTRAELPGIIMQILLAKNVPITKIDDEQVEFFCKLLNQLRQDAIPNAPEFTFVRGASDVDDIHHTFSILGNNNLQISICNGPHNQESDIVKTYIIKLRRKNGKLDLEFLKEQVAVLTGASSVPPHAVLAQIQNQPVSQ
jgi:hypothetical protein